MGKLIVGNEVLGSEGHYFIYIKGRKVIDIAEHIMQLSKDEKLIKMGVDADYSLFGKYGKSRHRTSLSWFSKLTFPQIIDMLECTIDFHNKYEYVDGEAVLRVEKPQKPTKSTKPQKSSGEAQLSLSLF